MIGLRRALIAIAVVGFLFGLAEIPLILGSDFAGLRGLQLAITLAAGWGFIGTGLFLWARRPDNQIGPLMTLVGFLWFVSQLSASDLPLLFTVGHALGSVYVAATMQLVLSYPSGELTERRDRIVVAVAYVITTVGLLVMGLFLDPADDGCPECPDNLALVSPNTDVATALDVAFSVVAVVLLAIVIATLIRRWREAGPGRATLLGPVYLLIGLLLTMLVLTLAVDLFGAPDWVETVFFISGVACFAAMPYSFLGALARSGSSRRASPSGDGSSATSMTARSSDSSRSRSICAWRAGRYATTQTRPSAYSTARPRSSAARSPSCVSWRAGSIRPCSAIAVSQPRSRRSRVVRRCRSSYAAVAMRACRRRSSRRRTSSSPRRSPTSPSTRRRRRRRWSCGARMGPLRFRSATTASAAPTRPPAAVSAGLPTASRHSTAVSTSSHPLERAPR